MKLSVPLRFCAIILCALCVLCGCQTPPTVAHGTPLWSRVGTSLAHGATAVRIGAGALISDFALVTATASGPTITIKFFDFTNRNPMPAPLAPGSTK
jgi:hypothetical protein